MTIANNLLEALVTNGIGSKEDHVKVRYGNILKDFSNRKFEVLALGCSCFNTYDRGLISNLFKNIEGVEECLQQTTDGDFSKLGTNLYLAMGDQVIVFMFIQKSDYFRTQVKTSSKIHIPSLKKCVEDIAKTFKVADRIAMPQLGIFRNKNQWLNAKQAIEEVLDDNEANLTVYKVK